VYQAIFARFWHDKSGAFAILFGLTIGIIMLVIGSAVDYGRWMSARAQTQNAMDAAVLAASRVLQLGGSEAAALAAAQQYYDQNKSNLLGGNSKTVFSIENGQATAANSTSKINTPFLAIAGISSLPVTPSAKAVIASGGNSGSHVEIAMMLDITGSMYGSKLIAMKKATKDLIDTVIWDDQSVYTSRVALIPFNEHINVGPAYFKKLTNRTAKNGTTKTFTCVRERKGSNQFNSKAPSYSAGFFSYRSFYGKFCVTKTTIMPLSSDKTALNAHVDTFQAASSTAGHLGAQFAWYTLEPKFSSVWGTSRAGRPYGEIGKSLHKIAVLMTDGDYNQRYYGGSSFDQAATFCKNMKSKNIVVYTIGFEIDTAGKAYDHLLKCATSPDHFFNAENADQLGMAFRNIATSISSLRLRLTH